MCLGRVVGFPLDYRVMPTKASEGPGVRLTDRISLGVMAQVLDRDLIEDVLTETGRREKRSRLLPAHVVVRFCQAMCLFYDDDYEEVMEKLAASLKDANSWSGSWHVPSASAIAQARRRLGHEPLRELFDRRAVPVADSGTRGAWLAGRRLMAVDGFLLDVADTPENSEEFGRPTSGEKSGAFPQARIVALGECGTHAIIAAEIEGWHDAEQTLARRLISGVEEDMLVIADRNFYGFDHWRAYREQGADLLWRVKANLRLPVLPVLSDGSYLSVVFDPAVRRARRQQLVNSAREAIDTPLRETAHRALGESAEIVRVVEYEVPDRHGNGSGELICVISSIHDVSASDLAAAYHERWEAENAFNEIKTHQRGPARVLRSKSPDMVRQEIWALLLTHYSIRHLMCQAADEADVDPDRLSFTRSLRIIRRRLTEPADFPP